MIASSAIPARLPGAAEQPGLLSPMVRAVRRSFNRFAVIHRLFCPFYSTETPVVGWPMMLTEINIKWPKC
jgi:hypothetical protein